MKNSFALEIENLSVSYMETEALSDISCKIEPNQLVGIIGPNGGGKSTLIKAIMGLVSKDRGDIRIMDKSIKSAYRELAYVPQKSSIDPSFPILVKDVVVQGCYPHISWWKRPRLEDYKKVDECLEKVGMIDFKKRQIGKLSGGQLQRVLLARALAQEANIFFLDEPFTGIDMASENQIMSVLRELRQMKKTIFVVHHDLSKVKEYFDSLILLRRELIACGDKDEVLSPKNLERAYQGGGAIELNRNRLMVVNA